MMCVAVEMQTVDTVTVLFYAKHTTAWFAPLFTGPYSLSSHFVSPLQQCQLVVRTVTSCQGCFPISQSQSQSLTRGHCL